MKSTGRSPFYRLADIMEILRGRNGCPWDRAQTVGTIKKYLLEETREVIDAIKKKDVEEYKEELGDLLFQVIYHAQLAKEDGQFDIDDVCALCEEKMKRRHPHVFGKRKAGTPSEVLKLWRRIKRKEKDEKRNNSGKSSKRHKIRR